MVDPYNASQDKFELVMEFRNDVDSVIASVLPAGGGPDLVYGSGPALPPHVRAPVRGRGASGLDGALRREVRLA